MFRINKMTKILCIYGITVMCEDPCNIINVITLNALKVSENAIIKLQISVIRKKNYCYRFSL